MKNAVSMVCALVFGGASIVGAAELTALDFSKAFPKEKLFSQTDLGGMQNYMYLTDASFPELKKQFVAFLGKGWKEENAEEYKRMLKQYGNQAKLAGISVFMHPNHPEKRIGLSLTMVEMAGKSGMLSVMVLDSEKQENL